MNRLLWLALAAAACVVLAATPAAAIIVNGATPAHNYRFSSGYPSAPVPNDDPTFIGAGYDWSGVGWATNNANASFALLGPRHYLYAAHYPATQWGGTLSFFSTDNVVKTYAIQSESGSLLGDLAVGTLAAPIPETDNVHHYAILFKGYSNNSYVGDQLLNYGWTAKIGWNQISRIGTGTSLGLGVPGSYFEYLADTTTPDRTKLVGGDSGSPSFVTTGTPGEMYLAGAHYAVWDDGSGSLDTALALMLPQINAEMAKTGYLPYVVTPVSSQWTGGANGNWGAAANWFPNGVPGDQLTAGKVTKCASLLFDGAATAERTISLGQDRTVTGITFGEALGANAFTFASGNTLTLGEAGIRNLDDDAQTFDCGIKLRSSQRWDVGSGGMIVAGAINTDAGYLLLIEGAGDALLSGAISGTGGLSKDGLGILTLGGSTGNTYSGKTFVNGGTLRLADASALGSIAAGTIVVGGVLDLNGLSIGGETLSLSGLGIGGNGALTNGSALAASLSGAVTLAGDAAVGGAGDIALGGAFYYGAYTLTKTAADTLALSGSQTWGDAAAVAVLAGMLRYNLDAGKTVGVGIGNTATVANAATLELAGSQSALSDGTRHVDVLNNSTAAAGLLVTGTNQAVGGISGSGSTLVQAGAGLTADFILQDTLTIGSGASVTIRAVPTSLAVAGAYATYAPPADHYGVADLSGGGSTTVGTGVAIEGAGDGGLSGLEPASTTGGGSRGVSTVPEPGTWALLATAALCLGWFARRRRRADALHD